MRGLMRDLAALHLGIQEPLMVKTRTEHPQVSLA